MLLWVLYKPFLLHLLNEENLKTIKIQNVYRNINVVNVRVSLFKITRGVELDFSFIEYVVIPSEQTATACLAV